MIHSFNPSRPTTLRSPLNISLLAHTELTILATVTAISQVFVFVLTIFLYGWQLGMHFTLSTSSHDPQAEYRTVQVVTTLNMILYSLALAEQTAKTAYDSWSLTLICNSQENVCAWVLILSLLETCLLLMLSLSFSLRVIYFPDDC